MFCFHILLVLFLLGLCVVSSKNTDPSNSTVADTSIDNHPSWQFIPIKTCGKGRSLVRSRIVGGKKASLGEFPWMARLGLSHRTYFGRFLEFSCGGTLISRFYVLTAAHCGTSYNIVRLGQTSEIRRNSCDDEGCEPPPQDIMVGRYFQPNFSAKTYVNDIMLIQLRHAAKFDDAECFLAASQATYSQHQNDRSEATNAGSQQEFTMPACLPRGEILNLDLVGRELIIAGWGLSSNTAETSSPDLMFAVVPILENNECDRRFTSNTLAKRQICAGFPRGPDSCAGDSGGPLTKSFGDGPDKQTYVMGIVSFGLQKCGRGPAVYTRVSFYMDWILDSINK